MGVVMSDIFSMKDGHGGEIGNVKLQSQSMVERVAAHILQASGDYCFPVDRAISLLFARAAIEAMREPTTPMLEAATRFENRRDEGRVEVNYVVVAMDIWPKMIDAALNPPKQKAGP